MKFKILILVTIISSHAHAINEYGKTLELFNTELNKKTDRDKIAKYFLKECSEMNNLVRELSPSEKSWLKNELENTRLLSLEKTTEYSLYVLKPIFRDCIYSSNFIINANTRTQEKYGWTALLLQLLSSDIQYHMKQSNIEFTLDQLKWTEHRFNFTGKEILTYILFKEIKKELLLENKENK